MTKISRRDKRAKSIEKVNNQLEAKNSDLTEQIERYKAVKNKEDELIKEKEKLEEKVNSLLDVLYGCPECGLYSCECDAVGDNSGQDQIIQQATPPKLLLAQLPPPLSNGSPPWTPPPTPPCLKCGGINYGPSPDSLCFDCLPPLKCAPHPSCSSSPSRTPPGSPPQRRLKGASDY